LIDWAAVYRQAEELTASLGVELDLRARVGGLGMARQQLVEIVKAMSYRPGVLLLDEPTSALAHHEVDRLLQLVRTLAASGVAVIYISHRLHELPQVADRVSVLRDGRLAGEAPIAEVSPRWLAERMFGEDIKAGQPSAVPPPGLPAFELVHFTRHGRFEDVSLGVRAGEVLGIAGMLGSGRTELLMSAFGAEPFDVGQVIVGGVTVARPTPARMKAARVALAPEDRKRQALVLLRSIRENLCMAAGPRLGRFGFTSRARERPLVAAMRRRLAIHMSDAEEPVESLSGGNQQKVVLGNWLATRPRVILLDEPTRGIDVHAKQQAFELIRQLSVEGVATILVSSELEELLEVCHRILVMRGGRLVGELDAGTTDARGLLAAVVEENALQIEN
jgi:ABC-type sugar transport system ATPase subunit